MRELQKHTIMNINEFLPYLSYSRDGKLRIEGIDARDLILKYDTPCLIFIESRIHDNYNSIQNAFSRLFKNARTFFALKSCYLSKCVQALKMIGANIEVMSEIELQIAFQNGFVSSQIVANGIGRSRSYIERSLHEPACLNIIDGFEDLIALQSIARTRGLTANIGLRVIPPVDVEGMMIRQSSKLGMDWEGGMFLDVLNAALSMPEVRVSGILIHQLSHCQSISQYSAVMAAAANVVRKIWKETGHAFDIIDIGGGFDTRFLLEQSGVTIADFAHEAWQHLSTLPYEFTLHIEPGRYIMADAAISLTRIMSEKHNKNIKWRICDISSNILIPLPDIAYPAIPTRLPKSNDWQQYNVGDGTLAPSLVCANTELPVGEEGRELVLLNCGAYTTVFAELWAFALPKILYLNKEGLQETFGKSQFLEMIRSYYGYSIDL